MHSVLELQQLSKRYGRKYGIEALSLAMTEGEAFGLVGPRGSGKTTTVRILLDLIRASEGQARIFGLDSRREGPATRKRIGYIPAEPHFYEEMRVKEVLDFTTKFYVKNSAKRLNELADYFELELKHRIEDLSFSGKKKVAIIQALVHNPELIIADEPTWGLPPAMQHKLLLLLRERHERGTAIFYATDVLGEAQNLCDRLAYLQEGRLMDIIDVDLLRESSFKKVRASASQALPTFSAPGVSELTISGSSLEFLYQGNIKQLLQILYNLPLHNIYIEEPDLEDVFYQFQESRNAANLGATVVKQPQMTPAAAQPPAQTPATVPPQPAQQAQAEPPARQDDPFAEPEEKPTKRSLFDRKQKEAEPDAEETAAPADTQPEPREKPRNIAAELTAPERPAATDEPQQSEEPVEAAPEQPDTATQPQEDAPDQPPESEPTATEEGEKA